MTAKEIEKILKADGWYFVTAKGSHNQYKHTVKSLFQIHRYGLRVLIININIL